MVVENLIDRKASFKDKLMNFFGANKKSCVTNEYDDFELMGDDFIISVLDFEAREDFNKAVFYEPLVIFGKYHTVQPVMKIDYNTENRAQGKFARMKILIDLWKPLIYNITIKDKIQRVEYKGLLNDYFEGDKYDYVKLIYPKIQDFVPVAESLKVSWKVEVERFGP
ncbi:hypothetical protein Goklo_012145 [Gossypium klotzschianum]|nr:hypothetical protein [Gossypium klotzschianum]